MRRFLPFLFGCLFIFCFPHLTYAELYINEFSSGDSIDWVELYNSGPDSIDLSAYIMRDSTDGATNQLDLTGIIEPNSFVAFDWSNRLNIDGDILTLRLESDNSVKDEISYGNDGELFAPQSGQSAGRQPDGSDNWVNFSTQSKGSTNNSSMVVPTATNTPVPTSEPTNTPSPTKVPTVTKSPTFTPLPTYTKVPTKKVTPTVKKSPTPKKISPTKQVEKKVLGEASDKKPTDSIEPSEEVKVKGSSLVNPGTILISVGGIFLIACGILLFYMKKKAQNTPQ